MKFEPINGLDSDETLFLGIMSAFSEDADLVDKYHCVEGTFEMCVTDTYIKVKQASSLYPMQWYNIYEGDEVIGYVVTCKTYNFLYSFGINIGYRTHENMATYFDKMSSLFDGGFTCGLWAKNIRAIEYMMKNGMKIYSKDESQVHLIYN